MEASNTARAEQVKVAVAQSCFEAILEIAYMGPRPKSK